MQEDGLTLGLYILIIIELILLYLAYRQSGYDLLSPSVVSVLGFLVSSVVLLFRVQLWKVELSVFTVLVISGGLAVFVLGDQFSKMLVKKVLAKEGTKEVFTVKGLSDTKVLIISSVFVIISVLYVIFVLNDIKISVKGNESIFNKLGDYRDLKDNGTIESNVPAMMDTLFSAVKAGCYTLIYLLLYDRKKENRFRLRHIYMITAVATVYLASMITSSRLTLILYPVAACIDYYMLNRQKFLKHGRKEQLKTIAVFGGSAVAVIILFVLVRNLIGRDDRSDPLYYISLYIAGPIKCLDSFLRKGVFDRSIFGGETLIGFNRFIGVHFNVPELVYSVHKDFVYVGKLRIGNVYTCFRAYLNDFGPAGLVILTLLQSMVMNYMHRLIRKKDTEETHFLTIIYSYLYHTVPLMFYAEWFYSFYFAPVLVKNIIIMGAVYLFLWYDKEKIKALYHDIRKKVAAKGAQDE